MLQGVNLLEHVAFLSDHCVVLAELVLQDIGDPHIRKSFHETYWKLNASIHKDEDFLDNFTDVWAELRTKQEDYEDIADYWDLEAKPNIKEFCIQF